MHQGQTLTTLTNAKPPVISQCPSSSYVTLSEQRRTHPPSDPQTHMQFIALHCVVLHLAVLKKSRLVVQKPWTLLHNQHSCCWFHLRLNQERRANLLYFTQRVTMAEKNGGTCTSSFLDHWRSRISVTQQLYLVLQKWQREKHVCGKTNNDRTQK